MNETLLVANASFNGGMVDVLAENGVFARIAPAGTINTVATHTIDAAGAIIAPAFYNTHTHAAMSFLRGYADDLELFSWLQNHIWPAESKLTSGMIQAASQMAILEMIHSGTVFFNDMYFEPVETLKAAEHLGVRAAVGRMFMDNGAPGAWERSLRSTEELEEHYANSSAKARLSLTWAPHAIYTMSEKALRWIAEQRERTGDMLHIHLSETVRENEECERAHGMSPAAWLDHCGLLGPFTILAHCVHLSDADRVLIRERGAAIASCPNSNAKLCSGIFDFERTVGKFGCRTSLATDGNASNNSLSMFSEMKAMALLAKIRSGNPETAPAEKVWEIATSGGAQAFGLNAGRIAEGCLADCILLRRDAIQLLPGYSLASDMVYSADTAVVDTVVCAGRILMRNGVVPGEDEIISGFRSMFPGKRKNGK